LSESSEGLEERLRRLEDIVAIQRLHHAYARCLDVRDIRAYAALFAEDGEWLSGESRAVGRDAIYELVTGIMDDLWREQEGRTVHLVGNATIEVEGDRAAGSVVWVFMRDSPADGPHVCLSGHYHDEYVRVQGSWLFGRRESFIDLPTPART
jgi:3-phenylpropionate/cinnamic acid dioxygenase small subunit